MIARTYGGAIALDAHPEPSIRRRTLEGYDAKRAIAKWAATQLLPGETILLDAGTTVGPLTESALARLSFDRAFLGADAVTADRGICEAELEQTRLKELMMERAGAVYVLAHAREAGCSALPRLGATASRRHSGH